MANSANLRFDKRIGRIEKKHKQLSRGNYTTVLRDDGLMVLKPRRRYGARTLTLLACVAVGAIVFKAATFTMLGEATFNARVAQLAAGTPIEAQIARVVAMEPVTEWVLDAGHKVWTESLIFADL
ncbi:MAG: hypothetical protein AAFO93_01020 [Pseudomonadota bacterium]